MKRTYDETKFKIRVMKDMKKIGGWGFKSQERTVRGIPDIIWCAKGRFIGIELKRDGEVATPLQLYRIKQTTEAGGIAFETTPKEWPEHREALKNFLSKL